MASQANPPAARRQPAPEPTKSVRVMLAIMRYVMPLVIAGIGVVLCIMGHGHYTSVFANRDSLLSALGVGFIIIAMMMYLLNWLMRLAAESGDDRDKEEAAREYFIRHGHWPSDS
jgi:hypothetical protein